jgi:hypothetical protein
LDPRRLRVGDLGYPGCCWLAAKRRFPVVALWELPKGTGWVPQGGAGGAGGPGEGTKWVGAKFGTKHAA